MEKEKREKRKEKRCDSKISVSTKSFFFSLFSFLSFIRNKVQLDLSKTLLFSISIASANIGMAQELRSTPFQYAFNQLALNPAYASRLPGLGFDATYFGNFNSTGQVSRTALVNVQGGTVNGGVGGTLQFFRNNAFGELTVRPAYAYRMYLSNEGEISFGGNIGLNYFDNDELIASNLQSDFFSMDGGFGIFYYKEDLFVGISALKVFEFSIGLDDNSGNTLFRENPYSLYAGYAFRLMDDIELVPRTLFRFININGLPDEGANSLGQDFSYDLQLGVMIQELYIISLLYGETNKDMGADQRRFGLSASYLLGPLKLTYSFQSNNLLESAVSLPNTHMINAAYDLMIEDEPKRRLF